MADVVQEKPPCIRMMNSILNYSADFLEVHLINPLSNHWILVNLTNILGQAALRSSMER